MSEEDIETNRQKTSDVWTHGTRQRRDGAWKWCCNYCDQTYALTVRSGRTIPVFNNAPKARAHLQDQHNITSALRKPLSSSGPREADSAGEVRGQKEAPNGSRRGRPRGSAIWNHGSDAGGGMWGCSACGETFEHRNHSTIKTHLRAKHGVFVEGGNTPVPSGRKKRRMRRAPTPQGAASTALTPVPAQQQVLGPMIPETPAAHGTTSEETPDLPPEAGTFVQRVLQAMPPVSVLHPPVPPSRPAPAARDTDADTLAQLFGRLQNSTSGVTRAKIAEAFKVVQDQFFDVEGLALVDSATWILLKVPLGLGQRISREAKKWLEENHSVQAFAMPASNHDPAEMQVRRESILT